MGMVLVWLLCGVLVVLWGRSDKQHPSHGAVDDFVFRLQPSATGARMRRLTHNETVRGGNNLTGAACTCCLLGNANATTTNELGLALAIENLRTRSRHLDGVSGASGTICLTDVIYNIMVALSSFVLVVVAVAAAPSRNSLIFVGTAARYLVEHVAADATTTSSFRGTIRWNTGIEPRGSAPDDDTATTTATAGLNQADTMLIVWVVLGVVASSVLFVVVCVALYNAKRKSWDKDPKAKVRITDEVLRTRKLREEWGHSDVEQQLVRSTVRKLLRKRTSAKIAILAAASVANSQNQQERTEAKAKATANANVDALSPSKRPPATAGPGSAKHQPAPRTPRASATTTTTQGAEGMRISLAQTPPSTTGAEVSSSSHSAGVAHEAQPRQPKKAPPQQRQQQRQHQRRQQQQRQREGKQDPHTLSLERELSALKARLLSLIHI